MTNETAAWQEQWQQRCSDVEAQSLPRDFRELLDNAVRTYGDRKALEFIDDGVSLTYRELYDEVVRIAAALSARGVTEATHVAVLVPNRIEFPLTWLALACLGAVMVPTNVSYTATELDYLYNDADVTFLVVDASLLPAFEQMQERPSALSDDRVFVIGGDDRRYPAFESLVAGGDPAFVPAGHAIA